MTAAELEKRLSVLEMEVANLKAAQPAKNQWWNKIAGAFADNPLFDEAMHKGQEQRERKSINGVSHRRVSAKRKAAK